MAKKKMLFEMEEEISFKDYLRYCNVVGKKKRQKTQMIEVFSAVIAFIAAGIGYYFDINLLMVGGVTFGVVMIFAALFMWRIDARKQYKANPMLSTGSHKVRFYTDFMEIRWGKEIGSTNYKNILEIIEDKDAFYIMLGELSGEIILKKACSEELIAYLQKKAERLK